MCVVAVPCRFWVVLPIVGSKALYLGEVATGVERVTGPMALDSGIAMESSASSGSYIYSVAEPHSSVP